jgi:hypothetical protein
MARMKALDLRYPQRQRTRSEWRASVLTTRETAANKHTKRQQKNSSTQSEILSCV